LIVLLVVVALLLLLLLPTRPAAGAQGGSAPAAWCGRVVLRDLLKKAPRIQRDGIAD
jgi:hypothetical protein